jgi:hypothetical protein
VLLDNKVDDTHATAEIGEGPAASRGRMKVKLEDLTRFTMVKRIW